MKISKITETKRGRFALFDEEGELLFSVDGETLVKNDIREGAALDAAALSELHAQRETRKAKDKALGYLSLRDHASGELYGKLCQKFDPHSAAAAVAEMQRLDLLDDEKFARHRAKYLLEKHKSAREISQSLARLGIDRETVQAVLEELDPSGEDACYAVVQKNYLRKLAAGERDKVLAALARRGFTFAEAKGAVQRALDELNDETEDL